jgi:hypothetical protein
MAVPTYLVTLSDDTGSTKYDITSYVLSVNITRGRSRELDKFEAGSFSITLQNNTRYFDPNNTSSPIYTLITPKRYIEIWSGGLKQFDGYVLDWNFSYDVSGESIATVIGADAFGFLANQALTGSVTTETSELTGARLTKVAADPRITWPFGGIYTVFDEGRRTLQADTIAPNTNALEYMQLIERTEGGYLYVSRDGALTFVQSANPLISLISFTDSGTAGAYNIPYQGIDIIYGSELLYTQVILTRLNGGTVTATRQTSINTYGAAAYQGDTYLHNANSETEKQAYLLVSKYSVPEYRFDSVTVSLTSLSATKQTNLLILDLANIADVTFKPNQTGSSITKTVRIIGIEHQMKPDDHIVTYRFASIVNEQLLLDNTVFAKLGSYVLGF